MPPEIEVLPCFGTPPFRAAQDTAGRQFGKIGQSRNLALLLTVWVQGIAGAKPVLTKAPRLPAKSLRVCLGLNCQSIMTRGRTSFPLPSLHYAFRPCMMPCPALHGALTQLTPGRRAGLLPHPSLCTRRHQEDQWATNILHQTSSGLRPRHIEALAQIPGKAIWKGA